MRVLPVLDLMHGVVVRGVAGQRDQYRPLVSRLTDSAEAVPIARALRAVCGHAQLYVADLDAILHGRPNIETYRQLIDAGCELWIDAGIRDVAMARQLTAALRARWILGLESLASPDSLTELLTIIPADRAVFSLDLQAGRPLAGPAWPPTAQEIAASVIATGVRSLIVLDLADVGSHTGGSTQPLCRALRASHPEVELIAGGGVRHPHDLRDWQQLDVQAILIASALHDTRITAADITNIARK